MSLSLTAYMGGHRLHAPMSADIALKTGERRLHVVDPDASGRKVTLPDARNYPNPGGPIFIVVNIDATDSVEIEDKAGGTVVGALGPEGAAILCLADVSTQAGTWVVRTGAI